MINAAGRAHLAQSPQTEQPAQRTGFVGPLRHAEKLPLGVMAARIPRRDARPSAAAPPKVVAHIFRPRHAV